MISSRTLKAFTLTMALAGATLSVAPAPAQSRAVSREIRDSYADVVDRVAPAVVTIRSAKRVRAAQQFPFMDDPLFRQFFGNGNRGRQQPDDRSTMQRALGSGVVVNPDGYILTNHHVVDGAEEITVDLNDRRTFTAKLVGSDAPSDLALLKIDATGLPVLQLGDSDKVRVGDFCLAVGNPLGIGETVTAGIISAKGRATGLSDGSFEDFLQTDAAINQGNSGGALVSVHGELIGISSQILSPSGGNIGIGFAIPSNMAKNVMDQLKSGGKVRRGRLGVGIQEITSDLSKSLDLPDTRGVLVNSVDRDGPADRAGVHPGDIITTIDGVKVDNMNSLRNRIAATAPGSEVALGVLRDGKPETLRARLVELPGGTKDATSPADANQPGHEQLGITVETGTQGLRVTSVDPSGPAAEAGIQQNDLILEVNRQPVHSTSELSASLRRTAAGRPALILVSRDGRTIFLPVRIR